MAFRRQVNRPGLAYLKALSDDARKIVAYFHIYSVQAHIVVLDFQTVVFWFSKFYFLPKLLLD